MTGNENVCTCWWWKVRGRGRGWGGLRRLNKIKAYNLDFLNRHVPSLFAPALALFSGVDGHAALSTLDIYYG